jgi:hypothetical protein
MTKEQIKIDVQKQTRLDELYSFWKDPRERFNNSQRNNKNNCLNYLLIILVIITIVFLIKSLIV